MKRYNLLVPAALVCIFSSCDLNKTSSEESSVPVATPAAAPAPATNTAQTVSNQPAAPAANQNTTATPPASVAPVQLSTPVSGVTLNPAHGQPGHDCSIPVGQPLKKQSGSLSPQIATTPVQQQAPATTTAPAPSVFPATNSTVKLNPAHGQPGHRCDIPVGKPLN